MGAGPFDFHFHLACTLVQEPEVKEEVKQEIKQEEK